MSVGRRRKTCLPLCWSDGQEIPCPGVYRRSLGRSAQGLTHLAGAGFGEAEGAAFWEATDGREVPGKEASIFAGRRGG